MAKKFFKIFLLGIGVVILILFILIIIGVLIEKGVIATDEKKAHISVEYTPGEEIANIDENTIPDSDYNKTLQEAIDNNGAELEEEKEYQKNIDEIIKFWENDKYILIFFRSVKDKNEECFTMAKFKKKMIDGVNQYVFVAGIPSYYEKDSLYSENVKSTVSGQLTLSDYMQNINIDSQNTRFIYGESRFKKIKTLKIEGQEPTEIIPYEVLGKQWYFWYYENFESNKAGNSLEFTFKN